MQCWAERYCKGHPQKCQQFCKGYTMLEVLYSQSNIPKKYQYPPQKLIVDPMDRDVIIQLKEMLDGNVADWVYSGNSLLLWGEGKGTGKTMMACLLANKFIRQCAALVNNLDPVVYFMKTAKFLEEVRQQFDNPTPQFKGVLELIEKVPLLIMDDIGAEKPSDWVRERLLNIIDERYSNDLSIIYTSNCNITEIEMNLHGRIADRIRDAKSFQFRGVSKRGLNNG